MPEPLELGLELEMAADQQRGFSPPSLEKVP